MNLVKNLRVSESIQYKDSSPLQLINTTAKNAHVLQTTAMVIDTVKIHTHKHLHTRDNIFDYYVEYTRKNIRWIIIMQTTVTGGV